MEWIVCGVCEDEFPVNEKELGVTCIECPSGHPTCMSCLEIGARVQLELQNFVKFAANGGNVLCQAKVAEKTECGNAFPLVKVAKILPELLVNQLITASNQVAVDRFREGSTNFDLANISPESKKITNVNIVMPPPSTPRAYANRNAESTASITPSADVRVGDNSTTTFLRANVSPNTNVITSGNTEVASTSTPRAYVNRNAESTATITPSAGIRVGDEMDRRRILISQSAFRRSRLNNVTSDNADTKACPSCSNPVYKDGGCNHMSAPHFGIAGSICKIHWCWLCSAILDSKSWRDHFTFDVGGCRMFDNL